jgi:hypothetical protein
MAFAARFTVDILRRNQPRRVRAFAGAAQTASSSFVSAFTCTVPAG